MASICALHMYAVGYEVYQHPPFFTNRSPQHWAQV
jgi:hypothetical protein